MLLKTLFYCSDKDINVKRIPKLKTKYLNIWIFHSNCSNFIKKRKPSLNSDEGLDLPVIHNSLLGLYKNEVTWSHLIIHITDGVQVIRTKYPNAQIFCSEFWNSPKINSILGRGLRPEWYYGAYSLIHQSKMFSGKFCQRKKLRKPLV